MTTKPPTQIEEYNLIVAINDCHNDLWLDHIEGFPIVGDFRSGAYDHPFQYRAMTNVRDGDDDAYEGIGWTVKEALTVLLSVLRNL